MKGIKVRIYPNKEQCILLEKHFGAARWIHNFGLELKIKTYNIEKKKISIYDISNLIPDLKKKKENSWLLEINSQILQQSLKNLDSAFLRFFKKENDFPNFKSKKYKSSFRVPQFFKFDFNTKLIFLPKFKDGIKFNDSRILCDKNIRSITVSKNSSNQYFASLLIETVLVDNKIKVQESKTLGIDLGIKTYATFSDGTKIENPKYFKKSLDKIKLNSEKLSRKKKDSKNYEKQRQRLAKTHLKILNQRKDFLQKLTTKLVENQNWDSFAIEDLSVEDMKGDIKNINRAIGDCGFRMFRSFLKYKCENVGKNLLVINRWAASSKTCTCGCKNESLTLDQRIWTCDNCKVTHDRDLLAANNIKTFALAGLANPSKEKSLKTSHSNLFLFTTSS